MAYFENIVEKAEQNRAKSAEAFSAWCESDRQAAVDRTEMIGSLAKKLVEKNNDEREAEMLREIELAKIRVEAEIRAKYRNAHPLAEYNKTDSDDALLELARNLI